MEAYAAMARCAGVRRRYDDMLLVAGDYGRLAQQQDNSDAKRAASYLVGSALERLSRDSDAIGPLTEASMAPSNDQTRSNALALLSYTFGKLGRNNEAVEMAASAADSALALGDVEAQKQALANLLIFARRLDPKSLLRSHGRMVHTRIGELAELDPEIASWFVDLALRTAPGHPDPDALKKTLGKVRKDRAIDRSVLSALADEVNRTSQSDGRAKAFGASAAVMDALRQEERAEALEDFVRELVVRVQDSGLLRDLADMLSDSPATSPLIDALRTRSLYLEEGGDPRYHRAREPRYCHDGPIYGASWGASHRPAEAR